MKSIYLYLILFTLSCYFALAQDVHFSQYYFSPLSLNPANTGNFKGDYRFFGNYRTQWRNLDKGFNTYSAGGDISIFPNNYNVGAGLILINDLSAENLGVTKILPSAAWHLKIAGFKIHLGIQPGLVIKSIDFYRHSFPEQLNWGTGKFDNTLPNSEPNVGQRFVFFDGSAGAIVSKKMGPVETLLGFSMFHINRPTESFLSNTKNNLPVRNALNGELTIHLSRLLVLHLHSLYGFTTKASDWVSGANLEMILNRDAFFTNSVFAGLMWRDGIQRNADAAIFTAGLNYSHYTFGFSFDLTQSKLKTSVNNQGAYELAIIYRGKSTRLTRKVVPCERY